MQVFSSLFSINKAEKPAVYLQIANQLTVLIRNGTLPPGYRLMSSRQLAELLHVHRRTIVQAYDELLAQGWLESQTGSGTFVANHLPEVRPEALSNQQQFRNRSMKKAGFDFSPMPHLERPVLRSSAGLHLDDGFPDPRLAPLEELSRAYRSQLLTGNSYTRLGYGDTHGSLWLRQELSAYLNETRGLKTTVDNILITRGTIMGLHLVSSGLMQRGDYVAVGEAGWYGANTNFIQAGARLLTIPVDSNGIDLDALEKHCLNKVIRLLYVTSHHHYPTTVALRADRRIRLLQLAEKYGFAIFEDDYDFDFHYQSKPLMPLASADHAGMVLYCGSFTKAISPGFRVGYLVGPENVIAHLAQLRRIIDRQGDIVLENAMAELLQTGIIQRHLRKSLRIYKQRRDHFCELMREKLGNYVTFQIPDGGMAVWTKFDENIHLTLLAEKALKKDLYFSNGNFHGMQNYTRLGFASSNTDELEKSVDVLSELLSKE